MDTNTMILIGVGTAICGGSAIAATAPAVQAKSDEVAQAISTIFLFNIIATVSFPFLGHLMHMSDYHFGLFAGTAINDTSAVVAAAYTFSDSAGDLAVVVKLTRTLLIIPITLFLAFYTVHKQQRSCTSTYKIAHTFPWFILGFIAASIVHTILPMDAALKDVLLQVGKYMIVMAMVAIGLHTNMIKLLKGGWKPLLLGLSCWIVLSVTSLVLQFI
ncbi:YeiH family protein [Paenibacillus yanchengensis]|uniref:YeiH family protein n=1 Tax=Paenibacillus yanchengensis TaxID=2035833 RepID=A0ABW4YHE0_9BACL